MNSGPIDPVNALRVAELSALLDPGYHRAETAYCTFEDGRGYVAVLTKMPGRSGSRIARVPVEHVVERLSARPGRRQVSSSSHQNVSLRA